jgi:hypothetical protein
MRLKRDSGVVMVAVVAQKSERDTIMEGRLPKSIGRFAC